MMIRCNVDLKAWPMTQDKTGNLILEMVMRKLQGFALFAVVVVLPMARNVQNVMGWEV